MAIDNRVGRLLEWKRRLGQALPRSPLHPLLCKAGALRAVQRAHRMGVKKEAIPPGQWFQARCERFQFRRRPGCMPGRSLAPLR
jgi:hypothetical protein